MKMLLKLPIAHRGLHNDSIPENSMGAFRAAMESGYAIETDVHFTKDKQLVLFHDDTLLRMTGDTRNIADCTFQELSDLRLAGTHEHIPRLCELLDLIGGKVPILLEIKNEPSANAKEFLSAIAHAFEGYTGEYAVQSFQPMYVRGYKKLCPNISCGLLTDTHPSLRDFSPPFAHLKRYAVSHMSLNFYIKPDFLSFNFHEPSKKMQRFRGAKFGWTVRSEADERIAKKYVDNIIFEGFRPNP